MKPTDERQLVERLLGLDRQQPLTSREIAQLQGTQLWELWGSAVQAAHALIETECALDPRHVEQPLLASDIVEGLDNLRDGRSFVAVRRECFEELLRRQGGLL